MRSESRKPIAYLSINLPIVIFDILLLKIKSYALTFLLVINEISATKNKRADISQMLWWGDSSFGGKVVKLIV